MYTGLAQETQFGCVDVTAVDYFRSCLEIALEIGIVLKMRTKAERSKICIGKFLSTVSKVSIAYYKPTLCCDRFFLRRGARVQYT